MKMQAKSKEREENVDEGDGWGKRETARVTLAPPDRPNVKMGEHTGKYDAGVSA